MSGRNNLELVQKYLEFFSHLWFTQSKVLHCCVSADLFVEGAESERVIS